MFIGVYDVLVCDTFTFNVQCHILGIVLFVLILQTTIVNAGGSYTCLFIFLDYKHSIAVYDIYIFTI